MFDVRKLVAQHARQLSFVENAPDTLRHRDRRMLGIAPGGERIGRLFGNHVNPGHRQTRPRSQILDQAVKFGIVVGGDFLSAIHFEHNFVAEPVTEEIHGARHEQRDHRPIRTAEHLTDPHYQCGQEREENRGTKTIHIFFLPFSGVSYEIGRLSQYR